MYSSMVSEQDWRLFKKKIGVWQENHMERLNREYVEILTSSKAASEKFWELEKRIRRDRRSRGVIVEMKRSNMIPCLLELLMDDIISKDDLEGFSSELVEELLLIVARNQEA